MADAKSTDQFQTLIPINPGNKYVTIQNLSTNDWDILVKPKHTTEWYRINPGFQVEIEPETSVRGLDVKNDDDAPEGLEQKINCIYDMKITVC